MKGFVRDLGKTISRKERAKKELSSNKGKELSLQKIFGLNEPNKASKSRNSAKRTED
jgi:hypothetical protein